MGPSSNEPQAVLAARAQALARPIGEPEHGETLDLVTFLLQDEAYAVASRSVLEMFRTVDVTPLPGAEPPVVGVTAWRGELLPVVDLRMLLGLSPTRLSAGGLLVVLGRERAVLALPADAPGDVRTIAAAAIRPATGLRTAEYVRGLTPRAEVLLDVEKILLVAGSEPV